MNHINTSKNPFPGIRSFKTDEHHLFFGRESQVEKIISVLDENHFLALVGYSGSGKSSLIKAGVIPDILKGKIENEKDWMISVFKPGDNPLQSFFLKYTETYNKKATERNDPLITLAESEDLLCSSPDSLLKAHQKLDSSPWLIVIDQFEEIFRYNRSDSIDSAKSNSQKFVNLFLNLVNLKKANVPIYIILTMRSDFLDNCADIPGLIEAINKGLFLIPRMTSKCLQDAIVKPILGTGAKISDKLVERLVQELNDRSEQLPVMQHALMRAWDYWVKNQIGDEPLDIVHYEAVGTISSSLSVHAEEIYNGLEDEKQKNLCERLFKALTEPGLDKRGTPRPTSVEDLVKLTSSSEFELFKVIEEFRAPGRAFLTPSHHVALNLKTVIDISHESFMRVWKRLKDWVEEETKSAELYLRLSKSAELYQQGKGSLWINPELEIAVNWQKEYKPNRYWGERYDLAFERAIEFLEFSKKESDFAIKKNEEKQQKELKRAKITVIFLSLASIISILILVISLNLRFQAEASEKIALEKSKIARIESIKAETQSKEAISQKRIAGQQKEIAEEQKSITEQQRQYAIQQQDSAQKSAIEAKIAKMAADSAAVSARLSAKVAEDAKAEADSLALEAQKSAEQAKISKINTERLRLLAIARSLAIQSQRTSGNDSTLAALLARQAYNFNLENGGRKDVPDIFNALSNIVDKKPEFRGHRDNVRDISMSKNGDLVFSGSDDGNLFIWNIKQPLANPVSLKTLGKTRNGIRCIAASNNMALAGTNDGLLLFWNKTDENTSPISIDAHIGIINKTSFISDDKFATVGSDGFFKIWDLNDLSKPFLSVQMGAPVKNLAISEDGSKLACISQNGLIHIYEIAFLDDRPIELSIQKKLQSIALNSTGSKLLTGDIYGVINLWDLALPNQRPQEFLDHVSTITSLAFSPNDSVFASSSYDNTIRIWNVKNPNQNPIIISDHDSWVMDIEFSSNGNQLVSAGNDKTIRLFEVNPDLLSSKVCDLVDRNLSMDEWESFVGKDVEYQNTCTLITSKRQ